MPRMIRYGLDHVKSIGSLMVKKVVYVTPSNSIRDVSRKLARYKIGCIAVVQNKKLIGIVSERDLATKLLKLGSNPFKQKVSKIMTSKVFTARKDDSLVKVAGMMQKQHIRHIPVVDDDNSVIGILSMRDLLTRIESNLRHLVKERTKDLNVDALTGLYNYRFFNNYLDAEIARSSRHNHHLSILFIDVDHFKNFNDSYGHAKGDLLLKEMSRYLRSQDTHRTNPAGTFSPRKSDIGVRIGGDEFVLILPETSKEGALFCAERLRQTIESQLGITKKGFPKRKMTVSIGISAFPLDAQNKKNLVEKADQALYQAKKLGRNRVYLYA